MSTSLSVIIPGYNTPNEWWERCLRSVIAALPEDGEVICVDDGSRVRPKISIQDTRIRWIYLEKNVGQSAARNVAIKVANGDYVTFVDSDDEVLSNVYRQVLADSDGGADVIVFGVRVVWKDESLQKEDVPRLRKSGVLTLAEVQELFDGCLFEYPVNKLFRRSFLNSHNFSFDDGICPGEDTVFNLKCVLAGATCPLVPIVGHV